VRRGDDDKDDELSRVNPREMFCRKLNYYVLQLKVKLAIIDIDYLHAAGDKFPMKRKDRYMKN